MNLARNGLRSVCAGLVLVASGGAAQAQNSAAAVDDGLSWHGITVFGIVDLGLQYENHGAPFSDYHPAGSANIVQKNSRQSVLGATPSNLSQSRVGLQGVEPVAGDWNAVFKIETFFNPQSGQISDASKSMTQNNGRTPANQTTNLNSSVAGQTFQTAYAGMSSKTFGTVTFGRQLTLVADGINKYDPNYGSQAFSLIGMSGPYAGAGDTEDKRLDESLKYVVEFEQLAHVGALFKFNQSTGSATSAFQLDVGGGYAGLAVDAYYSKVNSAISSAPLTAAQVALLPQGYTSDKSLAGTVSDNTTFSLMALYAVGPAKIFASWEHIKYADPKHPLPAGFDDIGGYKLAFVNTTAFVDPKILNVYWGGVRYTVMPGLDLTAAFYGVHQSAYATGAEAGCRTSAHAQCSGWLNAYSFDAVYTLTRRFDVYAGIMYSSVHDGFANGYTLQTNTVNPTLGVRYKF